MTGRKRTPVPVEASGPALPPTSPEINKRIDALVAAVRKEFGEESIFRLGDRETVTEMFPTGLPSLEAAIGVPGFPLAKLVQVVGAESVGKSTLVNFLAAKAQWAGISVHVLDGEMSEEKDRAAAIGVNPDLVTISEPETLEAAFQIAGTVIEHMKEAEDPSLLIFDSIAAFTMQADIERPFDEEGRRAARASFLSANLPKLIHPVKGTKIGVIFVNQLRERANAKPFQKPTYYPGGRALAHYNHLTLEMVRTGQIKERGAAVGITSQVRVAKSKIGVPFRRANINIYFDGRVTEGEVEAERDA